MPLSPPIGRSAGDELDAAPYFWPVAAVAVLAWLVSCWFLLSKYSAVPKARGAAYKARPQGGPVRTYMREEVACHTAAEDCWLIVDGKVYDVSGYVGEHPGGDAILKNAGKDSTKGFQGPQHPSRVFEQIDEYYIGDLAEVAAPPS